MARRLPKVYSTIRLKAWLNEESKLFRILALRGLRNLVRHQEMVKGPLTTGVVGFYSLANERTTPNIPWKLGEEDLRECRTGVNVVAFLTVYPLVPL